MRLIPSLRYGRCIHSTVWIKSRRKFSAPDASSGWPIRRAHAPHFMFTPKAVELSGDVRPFAWQNKPQFAIRPVRIAAAGGTLAEVALIWAGTRRVRRPGLR